MMTWRKLILVCILFFSLTKISAQIKVEIREDSKPDSPSDDTLYYSSDRKLTWDDFMGTRSHSRNYNAISFSRFGYTAQVREWQDSIHLEIITQTYFIKSASWVRPEGKSHYDLAHEQLHFDISKLAEQMFEDSVYRTSFSIQFYQPELTQILFHYWRVMDQLQNQFDTETRNGLLKLEQARWSGKVKKQLVYYKNRLSRYQNNK